MKCKDCIFGAHTSNDYRRRCTLQLEHMNVDCSCTCNANRIAALTAQLLPEVLPLNQAHLRYAQYHGCVLGMHPCAMVCEHRAACELVTREVMSEGGVHGTGVE